MLADTMDGMCTLSWLRRTDGFELFCNRDERRARRPAAAPKILEARTTRFVSPLDGDRGGSWIAVNEFGLALCLLNGPSRPDDAAQPTDPPRPSRGGIVTSLVACDSASEVAERLRQLALDRFPPFVLAAFEPQVRGTVAVWSGATLELRRAADPPNPLISSSFDTDEVRRTRLAVFRRLETGRWRNQTERHLAFHASHEPERGPSSTCMHRPDAHTVSFSRVIVGPRSVAFEYAPHSPCRGFPSGPAVTLPRRSDARVSKP